MTGNSGSTRVARIDASWAPVGWTVGEPAQWPDVVYIERPSGGAVSLDLKLRVWDSGIQLPRRFPHGVAHTYNGRGWRQQMVKDACAWLDAVMTGPGCPQSAARSGPQAGRLGDLKVGLRIKDNDPRVSGRILTVGAIDERYVTATNVRGQSFRILRTRVFADSNARRTGFSVMDGVGASPQPPQLLQDADRRLSRALSATPEARLHAREASQRLAHERAVELTRTQAGQGSRS